MKTKKKVLICGASGFVGFNIFNAFFKREEWEIYGTYQTDHYGRLKNIFTDLFSSRMKRVDLTNKDHIDMLLNGTHF